jgi:hypothetical protein
MIQDIEEIWKQNGIDIRSNPKMQDADFEKINVKAENKKPIVLWYNKCMCLFLHIIAMLTFNLDCGPGTNYGKKNPEPGDCLDLTCKLHDTYYGKEKADEALTTSVKYLLEKNMITDPKVRKYAGLIGSPMFYAGSTVWKNRNIAIWVLIAILIVLSTTTIAAAIIMH